MTSDVRIVLIASDGAKVATRVALQFQRVSKWSSTSCREAGVTHAPTERCCRGTTGQSSFRIFGIMIIVPVPFGFLSKMDIPVAGMSLLVEEQAILLFMRVFSANT